MRRPINWFVFCLSLAFLYANLSFGTRPAAFLSQPAPISAELDFSHVALVEPEPPQFGYVRTDGSFVPLARQSTAQSDGTAPSVASKVPARF